MAANAATSAAAGGGPAAGGTARARLVLATANTHKVIELTRILAAGQPLMSGFHALFSFGGMIGSLMGSLAAGYATGWRRERGGWWPPFAIAALALAGGVKFGA